MSLRAGMYGQNRPDDFFENVDGKLNAIRRHAGLLAARFPADSGEYMYNLKVSRFGVANAESIEPTQATAPTATS